MNETACVEKKQPLVTAAIEHLDRDLVELASQINQLNVNLGPVSRPPEPAADQEKQEESPIQAVQLLDGFARRARNMHAEVTDILQRLEI